MSINPAIQAASVRILLVVLFVVVSDLAAMAQASRESFRKFLAEHISLTDAEIAGLDNGDLVVRILKGKDKREVSVFGAVRLDQFENIDLAAFRDGLSQRGNDSMLGGARFGTPPALQDMAVLTLDDRDIEGMRNCVVGDCDLKLSAAMIKRLQAVDWNAADHAVRATDVLKDSLVAYAQDYLVRGDRALIEYVDKKKVVSLAEEYQLLLNDSVFVRNIAPEFENYLRKFPAVQLSGVENRLDWSKIDSGLKPIIALTHGVTYARYVNNDRLLLLATKQIYASHYVDASLAFSAFVRFGAGDNGEAYLVFTDISRSDALGGALSGMAHAVVEREAEQRVRELLENAKARLEARSRNQPVPVSEPTKNGIFSRIAAFAGGSAFSLILILCVAAVAVYFFFRSRADR